MRRLRPLLALVAVATSLLFVFTAQGRTQTPTPTSGVIVSLTAPPAIDRGLMNNDVSRAPDSWETRIRESVRVAGSTRDRVGASGAPYAAGRVIVKFRDGGSSTGRVSAMRVAAATADERPSYANF